jgi:uncharacterized protein DUF5658
LILVAAQVADVSTTRAMLGCLPGAIEANPFMAAVQAQLGQAWWLPKLAVAGMLVVLLCCATNRMNTRIAAPANVPETPGVASPSVLPLPHDPPAELQPLF